MPEDDQTLRELPIFRELGTSIHAAAVREDERHDVLTATVRRRRRRVRFAGAAFAVSAITAVAIIGPGINGSGPTLDPVASASAALSPEGGIVHLVMVGGPVNSDGTPRTATVGETGKIGVLGRRVELWSASSPDRFAQHTTVTSRDGQTLGTVQTGAAGDGRAWTKDFGTGAVSTRTDRVGDDDAFLTPDQANATPSVLSPQASNAATGVEELLKDGTFREQSKQTIDGRATVELVATQTNRPNPNPNAGPPEDLQVRYFVDADTSEPVRIDRYYRSRPSFGPGVSQAERDRLTAQEPGWVLFSRLDVKRYDRLPAGPAADELFEVPAGPAPELPTTFVGHTEVSDYLTAGTPISKTDLATQLRVHRDDSEVDATTARTVPNPNGTGQRWTVYRTGTSTCLFYDDRMRLCGTKTGLARSGTAILFNDPQPGDPDRGGADIVVRGIAVDDVTDVALLDESTNVIDRATPKASVFVLRAPAGTGVVSLRVTGTQGRVSTQRLR